MPPAKTPPETDTAETEPLQEMLKTLAALQETPQASQRDSARVFRGTDRSKPVKPRAARRTADRGHAANRARAVQAIARADSEQSRRAGRPGRRLTRGSSACASDSWSSATTRCERCSAELPPPARRAPPPCSRPTRRTAPDEPDATVTRSGSSALRRSSSVEDGWTLVVITSTGQTCARPSTETRSRPGYRCTSERADLDIARLEIRDHERRPAVPRARSGHTDPQRTQTQAAEIAGQAVERDEAAATATDEDPDGAPRVSYDDGIMQPTPNSTQGSGDQPCFARWPAYSNDPALTNPNVGYSDQVFRIHPYQLSQWLEQVWGFASTATFSNLPDQPPFLGDPGIVKALALPTTPTNPFDRLHALGHPARAGVRAGRTVRRAPGPAENPLLPLPWEHLIYAYLIENTGVVEILREVVRRFAAARRSKHRASTPSGGCGQPKSCSSETRRCSTYPD